MTIPSKDERKSMLDETIRGNDNRMGFKRVILFLSRLMNNASDINVNEIPQISVVACLAMSFQIKEPANKPAANIACLDVNMFLAIEYKEKMASAANMQENILVEGNVSPKVFDQATIPHIGSGGFTNGVSPKDR